VALAPPFRAQYVHSRSACFGRLRPMKENPTNYNFEPSVQDLVQKHKKIKRELRLVDGLHPLRIAVLGGVTTQEFVNFAEIYLLRMGFAPEFWQCEFNQYYESSVVDPADLVLFKPDLVFVLVHSINIEQWPLVGGSESDLDRLVELNLGKLKQIWESVSLNLSCQVIQSNFDCSISASLGNLDSVVPSGRNRLIRELNAAITREVNLRPELLLIDLQSLAAKIGWQNWFDPKRWFGYKIFTTAEASIELAKEFSALIGAIRGKSKKCLVLDLDNTLWGGVIGDDGVDAIVLGKDSALGEAFVAFQQYCLDLKSRGIVLAVCSKNDEANALLGFSHPDSVLKRSDFSAFFANWNPKHENIVAIAKLLNLGIDSLVFVDDNPVEREIVSTHLPSVGVPDVGNDVTNYIQRLESRRFFDSVGLSAEDASRAQMYMQNAERSEAIATFSSYGDFLDSLQMTAQIGKVNDQYVDRVVQLVNKTNQFNLTTKRYTLSQMQELRSNSNGLCLYGRLADKFGDNGLISVVIAQAINDELNIDLWVMSCRVLKRDMEYAMLDELVHQARAMGLRFLIGTYISSAKNGMVEFLFKDLGFTLEPDPVNSFSTKWRLSIQSYETRNKHIRML
jgi:FkbH-like protein